ncbi:MAG: hypothetical protein PUB04_04525 [Clostridia bacterium]|nr:hypothetical protein [Clostridia bacterium]
MIDAEGIMPLNFFKYKGVYSGQHNGMRYIIKPVGEKPDLKLSASVWRGPYASCAVSAENMTTSEFELTEEGRFAAVEWIKQQYEKRKEYWDAAPSIKQVEPIVHE